MKFKFLFSAFICLGLFTACSPSREEKKPIARETDRSSDAVSEKLLAEEGCKFVVDSETRIQCSPALDLRSLYAQKLAKIRYYRANREVTKSAKFDLANDTTRISLLLKQGKMLSELFFNLAAQNEISNFFASDDASSKHFYDLLLAIAKRDGIYVDVQIIEGKIVSSISGETLLSHMSRTEIETELNDKQFNDSMKDALISLLNVASVNK